MKRFALALVFTLAPQLGWAQTEVPSVPAPAPTQAQPAPATAPQAAAPAPAPMQPAPGSSTTRSTQGADFSSPSAVLDLSSLLSGNRVSDPADPDAAWLT